MSCMNWCQRCHSLNIFWWTSRHCAIAGIGDMLAPSDISLMWTEYWIERWCLLSFFGTLRCGSVFAITKQHISLYFVHSSAQQKGYETNNYTTNHGISKRSLCCSSALLFEWFAKCFWHEAPPKTVWIPWRWCWVRPSTSLCVITRAKPRRSDTWKPQNTTKSCCLPETLCAQLYERWRWCIWVRVALLFIWVLSVVHPLLCAPRQ